jgi:hypothetical protein
MPWQQSHREYVAMTVLVIGGVAEVAWITLILVAVAQLARVTT